MSNEEEPKEANQILRRLLSKKKPVLYGDDASPPVRFVMMTASLAHVDLDYYKIDLFKGDHLTEYYKKINPLQKVPALFKQGEVLCDSHAIALHFCRNYKNHGLYPEDESLRSKIDEMLFFNASELFPTDSNIFTRFFSGQWPIDQTSIDKWYLAVDHLEYKLSKQKFLIDDTVRLCDLCCGTTVSTLEILVPFLDRHKRVKEWLTELTKLPCNQINVLGLRRLNSFVKDVIEKAQAPL